MKVLRSIIVFCKDWTLYFTYTLTLSTSHMRSHDPSHTSHTRHMTLPTHHMTLPTHHTHVTWLSPYMTQLTWWRSSGRFSGVCSGCVHNVHSSHMTTCWTSSGLASGTWGEREGGREGEEWREGGWWEVGWKRAGERKWRKKVKEMGQRTEMKTQHSLSELPEKGTNDAKMSVYFFF